MDYSETLSALWGEVSITESTREVPLYEYDNGVEGFERFCSECLGIQVWSAQRKIVASVIENRRTAVVSGHSLGKSYIAAAIMVWWFCARGLCVVSTAPKKSHVLGVIWRYIGELYQKAVRKLPGEVMESGKLRVLGYKDWWGEGFTNDKAEGGQGYHAKKLLFVVDESPGCGPGVWASLRSSMASAGTRALLVGNANHADSHFRDIFVDPDGVGQVYEGKFQLSSWDSPNVTGECTIEGLADRQWCEEQKLLLERSDPEEYECKVLGKFPARSGAKIVLPEWYVKSSQKLWLELAEEEEDYADPLPWTSVFLDVSEGEGADKCALTGLRGQRFHVIKWWKPQGIGPNKVGKLDSVPGEVIEWIRSVPGHLKPLWLGVDADAVGAATFSALQLASYEHPEWFGRTQMVRFTFGGNPDEPEKYDKKISEIHWRLRQAINPDLPRHKRLALPPTGPDGVVAQTIIDQACKRLYERDLQIKVERKKKLLDRGNPSPDILDSIVAQMYRPKLASLGFFV